MAYETIRYERRDAFAILTLARPDKRNAMDSRMFAELAEATDTAWADQEIRGVLLRGEGPSFCAGIDLEALAGLAGLKGAGFRSFVRMAQRPFLALARMEKPTLAAVQGHAIGAGFQLALACDLRVAATGASFAMLEARYGLVPDLGGSHRLARLIGPGRAKELVWTTRKVGAQEALDIGMVNRMVGEDDLEATAEELLRQATVHSPVAVGLSKGLIDHAGETSLELELEREADAQTLCVQSEDHTEAVSAFLERREPRYLGR